MQWLIKFAIKELIQAVAKAVLEWLEKQRVKKEVKKEVDTIYNETKDDAVARANRLNDLLSRDIMR